MDKALRDVLNQASLELLPNGGDWTTTPPTEPGWYAVSGIFPGEVEMVKVFYDQHRRRMMVQMVGSEEDMALSDFSHWLGPLPVPAPPVDTDAKRD